MPEPQTEAGKPVADPERQALESIGAIVRAALDQDVIRGPVRDDVERKAVLSSGAGLVAARATPGIAALVARAKALYAARRRRDLAFGDQAGLLCDPVWDLMLDLFVAHYEGRRVSVSSACIAACVAPTTALRWITSLEHRNLIGRTPDCADKRRQFVDLSAEGLALIERAIAEF